MPSVICNRVASLRRACRPQPLKMANPPYRTGPARVHVPCACPNCVVFGTRTEIRRAERRRQKIRLAVRIMMASLMPMPPPRPPPPPRGHQGPWLALRSPSPPSPPFRSPPPTPPPVDTPPVAS